MNSNLTKQTSQKIRTKIHSERLVKWINEWRMDKWVNKWMQIGVFLDVSTEVAFLPWSLTPLLSHGVALSWYIDISANFVACLYLYLCVSLYLTLYWSVSSSLFPPSSAMLFSVYNFLILWLHFLCVCMCLCICLSLCICVSLWICASLCIFVSLYFSVSRSPPPSLPGHVVSLECVDLCREWNQCESLKNSLKCLKLCPLSFVKWNQCDAEKIDKTFGNLVVKVLWNEVNVLTP